MWKDRIRPPVVWYRKLPRYQLLIDGNPKANGHCRRVALAITSARVATITPPLVPLATKLKVGCGLPTVVQQTIALLRNLTGGSPSRTLQRAVTSVASAEPILPGQMPL